MITGVNFRPKFYSPAYNPVIWSVTSDRAGDTTYVDFKYVFDIYVDSVRVNRIKQRPNPANAGMLDVSLIVQSYLNIGRLADAILRVGKDELNTGLCEPAEANQH